ncbi:MAG: sulfite oxidase [Hyphomicrobiales bacterium]|nr:sulfite oxidase [Hyphomicrobiales bacterium]
MAWQKNDKRPVPSERGLFELYHDDPERADAVIFGRTPEADRRGFLKSAGLAAMGAALGSAIPFSRNMPDGFIPVALAQKKALKLTGKDGLTVLGDRPINAETPAHLLDDDVTPTNRHFVRNNGGVPDKTDAAGWTVEIDGFVNTPLKLSIDDLKKKFQVVTRKLIIECGGNGRAGFNPPASGNQWTYGAVANSEWTGVRLADVLKAAGLKPEAKYTGNYGADPHLSGDPKKVTISRGVPIEKAMDPDTLIAFGMNGAQLHPLNGAPLRLVSPGWPGSTSHKWLKRIWIRDRVHDGSKMTGTSYRVPGYPVAPGEKVPKSAFEIIEAMPVKSLITNPQSGVTLAKGTKRMEVRGHAWAGDRAIKEVHVSNDFGATWVKADLSAAPNSHSWQRWKAAVEFPSHGYYEIWARATDEKGVMQPFAVAWNPKGYLNNAMHRIAVRVAA